MKSYEELQEENRLLKQRLAQYQHMETAAEAASGSEASTRLLASNRMYDLYLKNSYIAFLFGNFRNTVFFRLYQRVSKYFRPTMLIVRIIRWLMLFLTMVQTSVVLLFALVVSLVMLPVLGVIALVTYFIMLHERRRLSRDMETLFSKKRILVFFSSEVKNQFFDQNMRSLSEDYTVIVVQDGGGLFGNDGVDSTGRRRRFLTARKCGAQYYRVRQSYYFYLRKKYFKKAAMIALVY